MVNVLARHDVVAQHDIAAQHVEKKSEKNKQLVGNVSKLLEASHKRSLGNI